MAITAKHKKARIFRDYLIETEGVKMFKEEEKENAVLFRSAYSFGENDMKHFMLIIDDSVYLTMQSLIIRDIPQEKHGLVLELINQLQLKYPTVKYVLSPEGQLMTSAVFHAHEKNMDPQIIIRCTIEMMKVIAGQHYPQFKAVLEA